MSLIRFLGGMDGIEDDGRRFRARDLTAPVFPVVSTAGAAAWLLGDPAIAALFDAGTRDLLVRDRRDHPVFRPWLP